MPFGVRVRIILGMTPPHLQRAREFSIYIKEKKCPSTKFGRKFQTLMYPFYKKVPRYFRMSKTKLSICTFLHRGSYIAYIVLSYAIKYFIVKDRYLTTMYSLVVPHYFQSDITNILLRTVIFFLALYTREKFYFGFSGLGYKVYM